MAKYIQKGEAIDYVASADISLGDVISFTNCIGVAGNDIASGDTGVVYLEGIFSIDKDTSTALSVGDKVYYNTTDKKITTTSTDVPAGICVATATASATSALVKIG